MNDKPTLVRNLEILMSLTRPGGISLKTLAEQYHVHVRTIQRLIELYKDVGFVIDQIQGRYKINRVETKRNSKFDLSELLHFSKEEAWMLNNAIEGIPGKNVIKENLVKKLYSIYSSDTIVKNIIRQEDSEQFKIIYEAIANKYQLLVKEYTVSTANKGLHSVIIEPIEFASNFSRLWAYFPKQKKNFLLRLSGIDGVEATYEPQKCQTYHKIGLIDIFRGYGYTKTKIKLILNRRSYGFMLEEFPMSRSFIKKINHWEFELTTDVCHFSPVARFCLGLPQDIKIIEPDSLKEFMKKLPFEEYTYDSMEYAVSGELGDSNT